MQPSAAQPQWSRVWFEITCELPARNKWTRRFHESATMQDVMAVAHHFWGTELELGSSAYIAMCPHEGPWSSPKYTGWWVQIGEIFAGWPAKYRRQRIRSFCIRIRARERKSDLQHLAQTSKRYLRLVRSRQCDQLGCLPLEFQQALRVFTFPAGTELTERQVEALADVLAEERRCILLVSLDLRGVKLNVEFVHGVHCAALDKFGLAAVRYSTCLGTLSGICLLKLGEENDHLVVQPRRDGAAARAAGRRPRGEAAPR